MMLLLCVYYAVYYNMYSVCIISFCLYKFASYPCITPIENTQLGNESANHIAVYCHLNVDYVLLLTLPVDITG